MKRRASIAFIAIVAACGLSVLFYWHEGRIPQSRWMGRVVSQGSDGERVVALTFNGGPNLVWTDRIAATLSSEHLIGTFFLAGENLRGHTDIARNLLARNQLVGNLGTSVSGGSWWSPTWEDSRSTQQLIAHDLHVCPAYFRPAHGRHTPFMIHRIENSGMIAVTYTVEAHDWGPTSARTLADQVLGQIRPGSIVMFHDGLGRNLNRDRTVLYSALPMIISGLQRDGYTIVGLDQLLHRPALQHPEHCT